MKKILTLGIVIVALLSCIAIVHAIEPYGYAIQGYQHDYKSPFPYLGSSIYTDPNRAGPQRFTHLDERVQPAHRIQTTVYLEPPGGTRPLVHGFPHFAPRGVARIYSSQARANPAGEVLLTTKDIEPTYKMDSVYEGWLFDADTGYRASLGVFRVPFGGYGTLNYHITDYLDGYDFVLVTKEPFPDPDPQPGEVVLVGEISSQAQYVRPFTDYQRDFGYTSREAAS